VRGCTGAQEVRGVWGGWGALRRFVARGGVVLGGLAVGIVLAGRAAEVAAAAPGRADVLFRCAGYS